MKQTKIQKLEQELKDKERGLEIAIEVISALQKKIAKLERIIERK